MLHPELERRHVTAGNSAGLNDAAAAVVRHVATSTPRPRPRAAGPHRCRGRRSGVEPERTGLAPTLAIPKALDRAGWRSATSTCWRSTRRSARWRWPRSRALGIDHDDRERQRQRLRPRPPDRRHRGADGRDHAGRAATPRPHAGLRRHVRGRRHGLRPGPRAAVADPPASRAERVTELLRFPA